MSIVVEKGIEDPKTPPGKKEREKIHLSTGGSLLTKICGKGGATFETRIETKQKRTLIRNLAEDNFQPGEKKVKGGKLGVGGS